MAARKPASGLTEWDTPRVLPPTAYRLPPTAYVETEACEGREPLGVHAGKYGHANVDVVMNLDPHLAVDRSEHASDILDQATTERDSPKAKVALFRSLFARRDDVYASRGERPSTGSRLSAGCES